MYKNHLKHRLFTTKDLLLVLFLLFLFLLLFVSRAAKVHGSVSYFEVKTSSGDRFIYPSDSKETVRIASGGYSYLISITHGKAKVVEATCPDRLCVRSGEISLPGERIICIPGKLVITAKGDTEVDAVNR